jgi:hypothetical protein
MFLLLAVVVRISRDMMSVWFSHTKFNPNFPLARARRVMGGEFDR